MRRLKAKLKSQNGASMLLALLFFLVCALVAATVIMAAASNAGKTRSGREEQQKYFALSSALQLVCDELTSAEYRGQYGYTKEEKTEGPATNPVSYTLHTYKQETGIFACELENVLPLLLDFDALFAKNMQAFLDGKPKTGNNRYDGKVLPNVLQNSHEITLKVSETGDLDASETLKNDVTITAEVTDSYRIRLTAEIKGTDGYTNADYTYKLEAELTPKESSFPEPKDTPGETGTYTTDPLTWKLNWISKKELGEITP